MCAGGQGKARGRGSKAKGPRKMLKRILADDNEESLYQPEVAEQRFKKAQLAAEDDLLLSSLW